MEKYTAPKMEVVSFDKEAAISMLNFPCLSADSGGGPSFDLPGHGGTGNYDASC